MRVDRVLGALLVLWIFFGRVPDAARAMEGPGGGETDPFATLRADASANLFTGSASITVPILVPPGRKLVTPELALRYSSHAGLSFLGLGWSLPLGVLARVAERGVPSCVGADPEAFRLMLGASANELVPADPDRFQLEFDEGWAEAVPDRAGNVWQVRTREGLLYTFGGAESARVTQGGDRFHDPNGCAFTTAWHVTRLEDPNGNTLEIEYAKSGNTPLPSQILYGGNAAAGIAHPFRVRFESSDLEAAGRPILRSLASGADQRLEQRIERIVVELRTSPTAPFEEVRRYELAYDDSPDTADFLLASVAATDLPTRRFHYSTAIPTIVDELSEPVQDPETLGASLEFGPILALMDLNGDGLLDRLCVDGSGDWHAAYGETGGVQFTGYSACNGSGNWRVPNIPGVRLDRIDKLVDGQDVYLTIDIDGDGLPDLVRRASQSAPIHVYRGECTSAWDCGFSAQYEIWNSPYAGLSDRALRRTSLGNRGLQTLRDLVDMNGDGRPDLLRSRSNGDWEVYRNTGSGFETQALVIADMNELLAYSAHDDENAEEERQLIDVNNDGLVDWMMGVVHASPLDSSRRIPRIYYGIGPAGQRTGPFPFEGGPYLCPSSQPGVEAVLCTGANALPSGWAIVGAATVRLNTGSGFSEPILTPAPFWHDAGRAANRLRASWTASGSRESHTYRDFIDVNGDGRVDWVTSGDPYDGSHDWYVLYNQGDGRFGGDLVVREPAGMSPSGVSLGSVRPAATLGPVHRDLGRSFQHASPSDRSDRQVAVLDIDADGLPERVKSFGIGGSTRWELKRLRFGAPGTPHLRPLLLVRAEDGAGGTTHFEYAPSSRFVPPPSTAPRMPFVSWLVTGIRRTDGLCDLTPDDPDSLAGNPCLAAGHELVERIEYEEGAYDGLGRRFLGFARTRVRSGPVETGSTRELVFHQTPALRGKLVSETVYAGDAALVGRTHYDWRTLADGLRTQLYLQEQRVEEAALASPFGASEAQCVVHRNSITRAAGGSDPMTRIQRSCSMACEAAGPSDSLCDPAPPGKKEIETVWAEPISGALHPVFDRPAEIVTRHVDAAGETQTTAHLRHAYDGLARGLVDRGQLMLEESVIDETTPASAFKVFVHDGGSAVGPGNVTSVLVPVTGEARVPTVTEFDAEFALHPVRETAAVSNVGASAQRRIESRYDLRHGKRSETVGLQGRAAGDVAGTRYDSLGRPVCEFAPGTHCEDVAGSGGAFAASVEYRYAWGEPGAADPIARLSFVEIRRREPNAPAGFLVTRAYFDALGRERLTTGEQHVVDPPQPGGRAALVTVVSRQLEYGPNGKPVRSFAPYVAPASGLALTPPPGTAATQTSYVLNGNPQGHLDPAGRAFETTAYDGSRLQVYYLGRTVRRVDGLAPGSPAGEHTLESRDAHGRPTERRSLDGAGVELARWNAEYDGRDRVVAEWFGGDLATRITRHYDLLGRPLSTDDPDAGFWRVRHDEAGNEVFRDDPNPSQSVQSCFDGLNRVVLECVRSSDEPDPALCSASSPACTIAYRYRYDEATPILSTPNHGLGRLTSAEGPDGRHRYVHDVRGRVVLTLDEVRGESAVTRYHYRPDLDRLEGMTYPDGEHVRYGYDASGQTAWLSQVDAAGNWLAYYVREVLYDLHGRPLSIERGNLTTDRFEYHGPGENFALARQTSLVHAARPIDARVAHVDLAYPDYDAKGRLLRVDDLRDRTGPLSMSARYAYDAVGRLTSVTGAQTESFAYDALGNLSAIDDAVFARTAAAASPLGPHQFDRLGDPARTHWTMSYDASGRRTGKRRSDGAVVQQYAYDAFGFLRVSVVNGAATVMGYDHEGRRIVEAKGGRTRRFFGRHAESIDGRLVKYYFLGDRLVATRSDAPASASTPPLASPPLHPVVIALGACLLVVPFGRVRARLGTRVAPSGALGSSLLVLAASLPVVVPTLGCVGSANIRHYHLDRLGTPMAISGPAGELERQDRHSAFGKVRRFDAFGRPAAPDATSHREFTGHEVEPDSGLVYAGSRYYDPEQASFLTPDPAEEHASPYAYAGWDPINAFDPNGAELTLVAAILLALSAVLVVASAVVAGIQTGSTAAGFQTLGIGLAGLAAGVVVGLAAPAAAAASLIAPTTAATINSSLAVAAVGASVYGLTAAEDAAGAILAGAGLAVAVAGAAYALGYSGRVRGAAAGRPGSAAGGGSSGASAGAGDAPEGGIVRVQSISPQAAQRLALTAQQKMVQIAQATALMKVRAAIGDIRSAYAGRRGIDVYAEVLIEGPRIPHPTRVFAQHLLPNRVEITPTVVPTGRPPTPTLLAPVPWDRFRVHDFIPVLRGGVPVSAH